MASSRGHVEMRRDAKQPTMTTTTAAEWADQEKVSFETADDADLLAKLGYEQELTRKFSFISLLCLAFSILGTWPTMAQAMGTALTSGGSITILWGLLLVFICNLAVTSSLGELCSTWPTSLGQAFYVAQLVPGRWGRFLSYMTAWINTAGWIVLNASQVSFMTSFLLGMKVLFKPDWGGVTKGWVSFLVHIGIAIVGTVFNCVICRKDSLLPIFNKLLTAQGLILLFAFSIALLVTTGVRADTSYQSAKFVFSNWDNANGWPDGVAFFLGLVQASYSLTAFDATIHLCEEVPSPRTMVPRILNWSVIVGTVTGFFFMVVCLFCLQSVDSVTNSNTGLPFMQLCYDAMGLVVAAVLLSQYILTGVFSSFIIATTSARLTWSFARDGGLPFARYFSHVSPYWRVPVRATVLQGAIVCLIGVLYTFSNFTLTAVLSVSTIALTISYAIPIACLLCVGRKTLTPGPYHMGFGPLGYIANIVSVVYCVITTVFFFFPASPDPAPIDMNYAIAVFGIVLILAAAMWIGVGRKRFLTANRMVTVAHTSAAAAAARGGAGAGAGAGAGEVVMDDRRNSRLPPQATDEHAIKEALKEHEHELQQLHLAQVSSERHG